MKYNFKESVLVSMIDTMEKEGFDIDHEIKKFIEENFEYEKIPELIIMEIKEGYGTGYKFIEYEKTLVYKKQNTINIPHTSKEKKIKIIINYIKKLIEMYYEIKIRNLYFYNEYIKFNYNNTKISLFKGKLIDKEVFKNKNKKIHEIGSIINIFNINFEIIRIYKVSKMYYYTLENKDYDIFIDISSLYFYNNDNINNIKHSILDKKIIYNGIPVTITGLAYEGYLEVTLCNCLGKDKAVTSDMLLNHLEEDRKLAAKEYLINTGIYNSLLSLLKKKLISNYRDYVNEYNNSIKDAKKRIKESDFDMVFKYLNKE